MQYEAQSPEPKQSRARRASRLAVLEDVEEIKKLKANYWWYVDNKLWKEWGDLFTENVHFIVRGDLVATSREELVPKIEGALAPYRTIHQGHAPVIEVTGPATATGRWTFFDSITAADGRCSEGHGYYIEEYAKGKDGRWRISYCQIERLKKSGDVPPALGSKGTVST